MHRLVIISILLVFAGCSESDSRLFTLLDGNQTGIRFKNTLKEDETANVLNYTYFYNGGGVAVGDINSDGLADVLFTGNMVPNRLYLNKGDFEFTDVTAHSNVAALQGWCTGATMADINADGWLDIYICRSADTDPRRRKNLLYINNGDLTFNEEAEKYGLADEGYSTQASFFDYDKDGDLDMFLINHSLQQYAFGGYDDPSIRKKWQPEFASKLYRNDNGRYADVSAAAGITSNVLSFGLGLAVSDVNNDGWPDVYVSNDFNEQDYLFINNGNGTFSEKLGDCMDESSLYSMGSDIADVNNDGYTDVMTLDMLPEDNHLQKMHSGAENFEKFQMLFSKGFYNQYSRNMLHNNNGDGTFSEIGQLAGVSSTDWSWAALFSDFDNDGLKDLFVTNGYAKDFTDMDFIQYNVDRVVRQRKGQEVGSAMEVLNKMPSVNLPNYVFRNGGGDRFDKKTEEWGLEQNSISSGAAYCDLDNDGDMDLLVNNINQEAFVYRNNAESVSPANHFVSVQLAGGEKNIHGIGAKVTLYCGTNAYYQEQMPVRGYQSSVQQALNFGIGPNKSVDSLRVVWPDDKMQVLKKVAAGERLTLKWKDADRVWQPVHGRAHPYLSEAPAPPVVHEEKDFNDFGVQFLLPAYLSRQGPGMTTADVNGDGRQDLFIGGAKGQPASLLIGNNSGQFEKRPAAVFAADSMCEDIDAAFFDADGDGDPDLYVASGGYEFESNDSRLNDRLYFNDGKGNFSKDRDMLPQLLFSKSCVRPNDIDNDGDIDLFVGGRVVPGRYPVSPPSTILLNDGRGNFKETPSEVLKRLGMVTDAAWTDVNGDGVKDLLVVGEWMPVKVFINRGGRLSDESDNYIRFPSSGWWNRLLVADFDGDGDEDVVIGNVGLNTQFRVDTAAPATLYYKDFDGNGSVDPVLCYYIDGVSYPAASRDDLTAQLPMLKKKFLTYASYADAKIGDLFTADELKGAQVLSAETMETVFMQNDGEKGFALRSLPVEMQYAPIYAMAAADVNHDGYRDIVAAGNQSWTRIKFGRYRANHGVVLLGDGKNNFSYVPQTQSGLNVREDVRKIVVLDGSTFIFGANNARPAAYGVR
jgi:hypothetical protein